MFNGEISLRIFISIPYKARTSLFTFSEIKKLFSPYNILYCNLFIHVPIRFFFAQEFILNSWVFLLFNFVIINSDLWSNYRYWRALNLTSKIKLFARLDKTLFWHLILNLTRVGNKQLMLFNLSDYNYDTEKIIAYRTKLSLKYNIG